MKTAFHLLFALFVSGAAMMANEEATRFDIETLMGDVYKNSRIIKVTPADLTLMHDSGVARISFENLTDKWREKFRYDPEKAAAYQEKLAQQQKEAEVRRKQANEKREREERRFIAQIEAQERKLAAANAEPPALAPLPGEENTPTPAMPRAFEELVPATPRLGEVYEPGFRTSRSWRYGSGILSYDGYYPPFGWYPSPPVYCPPHHHHHHHGGGSYISRPIIRITR